MTSRSIGKGLYLLLVAVLAVAVSWAVWQVPQPWRGVLVLWIFGAATVGGLAALVLGRHREVAALRQQQGIRQPARRAERRPPLPRRRGPRVITMASDQATRLILR